MSIGVARRSHLARLLVNVEAGEAVLVHVTAALVDYVMRQFVGEVGLPCAAGAGQDDPAVLHQQIQVTLDYGFRD